MEANTLIQTETNSELVRRGYEAFNHADIQALDQLFHDDATWHTPGKGSISGLRKGKQAVFGHFGRYGAETNGTFRANLKSIAETADGLVVGIHRNTGERNGKKLDVDCCIVFELKDGQLVHGTEYFFDLNAWEAFWA